MRTVGIAKADLTVKSQRVNLLASAGHKRYYLSGPMAARPLSSAYGRLLPADRGRRPDAV